MQESEAPVEVYLGEPRRRDPRIAFLLTLVCPGLGSVYLGHLLKGVSICLSYVLAFGGFALMWASLKFFPVLPLLVIVAGLSVITVLLALDAAREAGRAGSRYILRSSNHPVVYALVAVLAFFLPAAALVQFTGERLWALIWVETDAMFPTLVPGDLVLVDRTAYHDAGVRPGDVVVLRHVGEGGQLRLGRIVGLPGDEVRVTDTVPVINGVSLARSLVWMDDREVAIRLAALDDVTRPEGLVTFAEQHGEAQYLTSETPAMVGGVFQPVRLGRDQYYVLHDNRTAYGDSRDFGPVARRDIVGQPLYIAYSGSSENGVRWGRLAKRVQPEPVSR